MEEIVKALLDIFPFSIWFQRIGLNVKVSDSLSFLVILLLLWLIVYLTKKIYLRYRNSCSAKNLYPQFDLKSIIEYTKYYIPTQSQNASPTLEEEPGFSSKHMIRQKLIPFLLKFGFNNIKEANKYHIILADSGMGKTTFMVNLYMRYISFWNFNKKKGIKIKLYRLGNVDTLDLIKKIDLEEAKNTILLLDALDEDPHGCSILQKVLITI
jgi:sulfatase modifying factor 1